MKKKNIKFKPLSPEILDKNAPIYTEALDYVFSNDDIKNIAITGIYGAGKSTVWRTYVNQKKLKNIITVSLGKFNDINSTEDNNIKNNRIERQIINQILSQLKTNNILLSKYKFKENKGVFNIIINMLPILFVLLLIGGWLLKKIDGFIPLIYNISSYLFMTIYIIMVAVPIMIIYYKFIRSNRFVISKINISGTEASFNEENLENETILDKDIKEIVYLLSSSKVNVVIFEDLDRYDNIDVFTKLRELNFLLNSFISNNNTKCVKFIYILRDGLFFSKNRTKFFDFILPIVPIINSHNSENKLMERLSVCINHPSSNVITKISLYINDMRLLNNIVNEYIIYESIIPIFDLELNVDKLFSLIVLKNIFPNEFDLLQEDKGYIFTLFGSLSDMKKDKIERLNSENYEIVNNYEECFSLTDIIDHKDDPIKTIQDARSLKEFLSLIDSSELDQILITEKYSDICNSHYYPLIKFLLLNGLIDETYWYYKGYFYPGKINRIDTIFIKNLLEGKKQDINLEIENPEEVYRRLELSDFKRFNILNKRLFEVCILSKYLKEIFNILYSVEKYNNHDDFVSILSTLDDKIIDKFVDILISENGDGYRLLNSIIMYSINNHTQLLNKIIISIYQNKKVKVDDNKLLDFNKYLYWDILFFIGDNSFERFIDKLKHTNFKFNDVYDEYRETYVETKNYINMVKIIER